MVSIVASCDSFWGLEELIQFQRAPKTQLAQPTGSRWTSEPQAVLVLVSRPHLRLHA